MVESHSLNDSLTQETSPMPVYLRAHVFEIDNPLDTKDGKKPIAVDRGPYTYRISRNKVGSQELGIYDC